MAYNGKIFLNIKPLKTYVSINFDFSKIIVGLSRIFLGLYLKIFF